jgi:hypothetical protein
MTATVMMAVVNQNGRKSEVPNSFKLVIPKKSTTISPVIQFATMRYKACNEKKAFHNLSLLEWLSRMSKLM